MLVGLGLWDPNRPTTAVGCWLSTYNSNEAFQHLVDRYVVVELKVDLSLVSARSSLCKADSKPEGKAAALAIVRLSRELTFSLIQEHLSGHVVGLLRERQPRLRQDRAGAVLSPSPARSTSKRWKKLILVATGTALCVGSAFAAYQGGGSYIIVAAIAANGAVAPTGMFLDSQYTSDV
ncbi:hypothetical protein ON010_g14445 [Phytophthora cinnamomi]|nr:hypothetical protein ON010_g14445 [Phytophthora cinnamomi]